MILSASSMELDHLQRMRAVSSNAYSSLSSDIEKRTVELASGLLQIQQANPELVEEEIRQARLRMLAAERVALHRGVIEGIVPQEVSEHLLAEAAEEIDRLSKSSRFN